MEQHAHCGPVARHGRAQGPHEGGADAHYVPTGHLVYVRSGTLMAVPFNLERLEVAGGPAVLVSDLMQATNVRAFHSNAGAGQFSLSASGALIYLPGGVAPELERSLIWVDRNGTEHPLPVPCAPTRPHGCRPMARAWPFIHVRPTPMCGSMTSPVERSAGSRPTDKVR